MANAILDGTDAVMLSGESAMGKYPLDAVSMLAEIAHATEPHRSIDETLQRLGEKKTAKTLIAHNIQLSVRNTHPKMVVTPTISGDMARNVSRYRLPVWIIAFCSKENTCQSLQFSYGVLPVKVEKERPEWTPFLREWFREHGVTDGFAIIAQGPSAEQPLSNHRMEFIDLSL